MKERFEESQNITFGDKKNRLSKWRLVVPIISPGLALFAISACGQSEEQILAQITCIQTPEPAKTDPTGSFLENQILLKLKNPDQISPEINNILKKHDACRIRPDVELEGPPFTIQVPEDEREALIEDLRDNPDVEFVELNYILYPQQDSK